MRMRNVICSVAAVALAVVVAGCSVESMDKFAKSTQDMLDALLGNSSSKPPSPSPDDRGDKTQTADGGSSTPKTPTGTQTPSTPNPPTGTPPGTPVASAARPGAVLAQGTVGPEGGRVEAPGKVRVDFPAGALDKKEKIVIRESAKPLKDAQLYFIDRDGGHNDLPKPAVVSVTVPAGADARKITPVEEMEESFWTETAGTYDAGTRQLAFKVSHFSGKGWVMEPSILTHTSPQPRIYYMGGDYVLSSQITQIDGGGNWGDATTNFGLHRNLRTGAGVRLFWADTSTLGHAIPSSTAFWAICDGSGNVIDRGWRNRPPKTAPEGHAIKSLARSVLIAAMEADAVKQYYTDAGYTPPAELLITIHRGVKQSSEGKEKCAGEWRTVTRHMVLNADFVQYPSPSGTTNARQSTLAHEYFHCIWQANGYSTGRYVGLEDCFCTAYEAEVFPGNTDSYGLYKTTIPKVLASGLCVKAEDEHAERRGYRLWPFGRFVIRQAGHDGVRKLVTGKYPEPDVAALFKQFALAVVASDRQLPQGLPQKPPTLTWGGTGQPTPVESGWTHFNVADMMMSLTTSDPETMPIYYKRPVDAGRHSFNWSQGVRPMSLAIFGFKMPGLPPSSDPEAADAPAVIVRRESMDPRELVWVLPSLEDPKGIDRKASADIVQGPGAAVLPRKRVQQKDAKPLYIVVALVNPWMNMAGQDSAIRANSIAVYRLSPPKDPAIKAGDDANKMRLTWSRPDLGGGAYWPAPRHVLSGYRVFGKDKQGKVVPVVDLSFDARPAGGAVTIDADANEVTLPATRLQDYEPIGIASVEAVVKDVAGQLLVSEIAWMEGEGIVEGTFGLPAGTFKKDSNNPFEVGGDWKPAAGEKVTLAYTCPPRLSKTLTAVTDKDGRFVFKGVPPGAEFTVSSGKYQQTGTTPVPMKRVTIWLGEADPSRTIEVKHTKSTN